MEGDNPTRRYKWFRPRRAARGYGTIGSGGISYSVSLYNNSPGVHVLAVRAVAGPGSDIHTECHQSVYGTLAMNGVPIITGEAVRAGQIFTGSGESLLTPDFVIVGDGDQAWNHDFPFAILLPGWSLHTQSATGGSVTVGFMWEAIEADELDFLDW